MDNFYPIVRAKDLFELSYGVDQVEDGILMWLGWDPVTPPTACWWTS